MKDEYERILRTRWDTIWLGEEGIDGVSILTQAAWPQRECYRVVAGDHPPVYVWQDCEGDAAEEYAELMDIDSDNVNVHRVSLRVRVQLKQITADFLQTL